MKNKVFVFILLSSFFIASCGTNETDYISLPEHSSSEIISSQSNANEDVESTTQDSISVVTETSSMEEIFVSDSFPEVVFQQQNENVFSLSINCDNTSVYHDENMVSCKNLIYRCDKRAVSFITIDYSNSSSTMEQCTYVYSTSGNRLSLTDVLNNEDLFVEYLNNKNYAVETEDLNSINWIFDLIGIIIFDSSGNDMLTIPYEETSEFVNTNYLIDENEAVYGHIRNFDSVLSLGHHSFQIMTPTPLIILDEERYTGFVSEDGNLYSEALINYIIRTPDNKYYLWVNETDYDPDENGNPILIYKCAMLVEITNGTPEVIATTTDGSTLYDDLADIPSDILELMNFSEW